MVTRVRLFQFPDYLPTSFLDGIEACVIYLFLIRLSICIDFIITPLHQDSGTQIYTKKSITIGGLSGQYYFGQKGQSYCSQRGPFCLAKGVKVAWLFHVGTFLMFTCIEAEKCPRIIMEISKLSYGMYLMHIFWLFLWVIIFKQELAFPTAVAIPSIALCTFICCFFSTKLISYIPGSKWLIG